MYSLLESNIDAPSNTDSLKFYAERPPNPANRLTLLREKDALGVSRIHVGVKDDPSVGASMARVLDDLVRALGRLGTGRVRIKIDPDHFTDFKGSFYAHHMGTTRMSRSPDHGVVDRDCLVFGTVNLYMAGSSVFPTGGFANPTFTIVALALRLADHLIKKV